MAVEDSRIFTFNANNANFYANSNQLSNVSFFIPKFLARHNADTAVYVAIENATLPSSWYNLDNCICSLFSGGVLLSSYTIPPGNYDAFTLTSQINTSWTALASAGLELSYSLQQNKIGLGWKTTPGPSTYRLSVSNRRIFGQTDDYLEITPFNANPVYFSNQLDLTGVNSYLIVCDECPTQNFSLQLNGNVIGCIQNAAANFGVTLWQNSSNLRYLVPTNRQIDQISIRIYNERGELINFNGIPWSLTLKVTYTKDKGVEFADFERFIHKINLIGNQSQNVPDAPDDSEQQPVAGP